MDRIQKILDISPVNQILVTDKNAIAYLTGKLIHPGERFMGLLLVKGKEPRLFLNILFKQEESKYSVIYYKDTQDPLDVLKEYIDDQLVLGVDKTMASKFLLGMMEKGIASDYVLGSTFVDIARATKEKDEIEKMRHASKINDQAMAKFVTLIHDGVTEKEVASQMLDIYKSLGADGYSFEPIVAFGKNAGDPHHEPDDTVLQDGDIVLFDVGCIVNGYCSDMTRSFFNKFVKDEEERKIYELVRMANENAESVIKPGVFISDVDKAARVTIEKGGYGEYFTHRLGHFIGTEVHEAPDVSSTNHQEEKVGYIHSVEPGIYLLGKMGVRIEDLIVVSEDGVEVLNHYPKELTIINQ